MMLMKLTLFLQSLKKIMFVKELPLEEKVCKSFSFRLFKRIGYDQI